VCVFGCRWFFQQLILAVDYCHKKGVANRDIKLENTLLAVSQTRHHIHASTLHQLTTTQTPRQYTTWQSVFCMISWVGEQLAVD